jgi:hypothetical protein
MSGSVSAIEAASLRPSDGLKLLQAVEDIEERRKLAATDIGRLIGALDKAMEGAAADRKPHDQRLLGIVRDKVIGDAICVLMRACRWELRSALDIALLRSASFILRRHQAE